MLLNIKSHCHKLDAIFKSMGLNRKYFDLITKICSLLITLNQLYLAPKMQGLNMGFQIFIYIFFIVKGNHEIFPFVCILALNNISNQ